MRRGSDGGMAQRSVHCLAWRVAWQAGSGECHSCPQGLRFVTASLPRLPCLGSTSKGELGYSLGRSGMGELDGRVAIVTGGGARSGGPLRWRSRRWGRRRRQRAAEPRGGGWRRARDRGQGRCGPGGDGGRGRRGGSGAHGGVSRERFGRIDILVNNAAGRPERRLEDLTLADSRGVLATILDGAFLTVKAALPQLRRAAPGSSSTSAACRATPAAGTGRTW